VKSLDKCQRVVISLSSQMKGATQMEKLAIMITPKGKVSKLDLNSSNELKQLQEAVDGYIEAVVLGPDLVMWVNEEGLLRDNLDINPVAFGFYPTPIMGNIVFTGGTDDEGETLALPAKYEPILRRTAKHCREMMSI